MTTSRLGFYSNIPCTYSSVQNKQGVLIHGTGGSEVISSSRPHKGVTQGLKLRF